MTAELLPLRSRYQREDDVVIELRGTDNHGELTLWHLGVERARWNSVASGHHSLGVLEPGGYGVEWVSGDESARTAVEVTGDPGARLRYGFAVDYRPGVDPSGLADTVRRLHLTDIQFYDWAYRHADLLGGGESYLDALGQPVALETVRRLVSGVQAAGARALGYAAVYAVGPAEWPEWKVHALLAADGEPYALGDFLFIVDPGAEPWSRHFTADLAASVTAIGFDGFHLDQYGYPKIARTGNGNVVDVATSFDSVIRAARDALPSAHLVFNNVNDFPTWTTGRSPQDAVYIEVWHPHDSLGSLARVVSRARAVGDDKPIVIAAYQHVYDSVEAVAADRATAFTMATLFSHGATHLLAGEADRILVDPYYVRNHVVEASTRHLLRRWYDFLVEHDELLLDPAIVDVTGAYAGTYNDDIDVSFGGVHVSDEAVAGQVWRRITRTAHGFVVHLINLAGQTDTLWDSPKNPISDLGEGMLRIRTVEGVLPRVRIADPDAAPRLHDVPVVMAAGGTHATALLPAPAAWQLVLIQLDPDGME